MQKLEQLQRKLSSAEELQSITRTMKVLSAVSIHQFEEAVTSLAEYFDTLEKGIQVVLRTAGSKYVSTVKQDQSSAIGVIVIGSGQSLCGPFDETLMTYIHENLGQYEPQAFHFKVLGERLAEQLQNDGYRLEKGLELPGSVEGITSVVITLLEGIQSWQVEHKVRSVMVIHNKPMARKGFSPRIQHLLPLNQAWLDRLKNRPWSTNNLPLYTIDTDVMFMSLLRQYLFVSLFRALAESLAAEHASRLRSMQRAEKKIEERLSRLRNEFLRERQSSITEELLDIMAGFEAVSGRE